MNRWMRKQAREHDDSMCKFFRMKFYLKIIALFVKRFLKSCSLNFKIARLFGNETFHLRNLWLLFYIIKLKSNLKNVRFLKNDDYDFTKTIYKYQTKIFIRIWCYAQNLLMGWFDATFEISARTAKGKINHF